MGSNLHLNLIILKVYYASKLDSEVITYNMVKDRND